MKTYAFEFLTETGIQQYKQEASRHPNGFGLTECIGFWDFIDKMKAGYDLYIDRCSLKSLGKYRAMWFLENYALPEKNSDGRHYLSSKLRFAFDCSSDRIALVSLSEYEKSLGEGNIINSFSIKEDKWNFADAAPKSIGSFQLREACSLPAPK